MRKLLLIVSLGMMLVAGAPAAEPERKETLAERAFPEDTLLVLTIPDLSASSRRFKETALYKIWKEEELQKFVKEGCQFLAELQEEVEEKLGLKLAEISACLTGELSVGILKLEPVDDKLRPTLALVAGVGQEKARLQGLIDGWLKKAKERDADTEIKRFKVGEVEVQSLDDPGKPDKGPAWAFVENTLVVLYPPGEIEPVLKRLAGGEAKTLGRDEAYRKVRARLGAEQEAFAAVNLPGLLKVLLAASIRNDPGTKHKCKAVELSRLAELGVLGLGTKIEAPALIDRLVFSAPARREGIFRLLSEEKADETLLKFVPRDTDSLFLGKLEVEDAWKELKRIIREVGTEFADEFAEKVADIKKEFGFDLELDLIGALGKDVLLYVGQPPGAIIPEVVLLWELKDGGKVKPALDKLLEVLKEELGEEEAKPATFTYGKYTVTYLQLPEAPVAPAYAFTDKHLVVALSAQSIKRALKQYDAPATSILDSPDFKAATGHLPAGRIFLSYSDVKKGFTHLYGMLQPFAAIMMIGRAEAPVNFALLPRAEVIGQHLFGRAVCLVEEKGGYLVVDYSPVGGVSVVPAAVAITAAITGRKLLTSRRVPPASCVNNLKQLGLACHMYAADFDEKFPARLEDLFDKYVADPELFQCPNAADRASRHHYLYVTGLDLTKPADCILIYDRVINHRGKGRNVLFLDGHVEWMDEARFQELVKKQVERKLGNFPAEPAPAAQPDRPAPRPPARAPVPEEF